MERYLYEQNLHWDNHRYNVGTERKLIKEVVPLIVTDQIIAVSGVRRCGKSVLLKQIINYLIDSGVKNSNILLVNLELPVFVSENSNDILNQLFEMYLRLQNPMGKFYVFFDEIQTIPQWEKWLKYHYDQRKGEIKFFITGSNSQLLSSEFATLLSGRVIEKRLYPFSLSEILTFNGVKHDNMQQMIINKSQMLHHLDSYFEYGGMPELLSIDLVETKRELLLSYFNTIIYKDIIPRFSLRADKTVYKLALFLIANATSLMNIKRLSEHLSIAKREDTKSYIDYLQQALLLSVVSKFDFSMKTQLYSQKKSYAIDTGFINLLPIRFSQNKGKLLENCVYIHLVKQYQEVFYYMSNQSECDFISVQSLSEFFCFQVCYELNDINRKREIKGLLSALAKTNAKQGFIITYDQEEEIEINAQKIKVIPFWKWVLMS